jgi:hypothetical protein
MMWRRKIFSRRAADDTDTDTRRFVGQLSY